MRKLLLILNPAAGRKASQTRLFRQVDAFTEAGWEVTVSPTRGAGDAGRLARERGADFELVVCTGGDGTLSETAAGLMELEPAVCPALGYIPSGTTNDFAAAMGIKPTAHGILEGEPFPLDVGTMNGTSFIYLSAFGLLTEVGYTTPQASKNTLGRAAYFFEGAKRLTEIQTYNMSVTADDVTLNGEFIFGAVSNSTSIAGLIHYDTDEILFDDGLLELLLIKNPGSPPALTRILLEIMSQNYTDEHVVFLRASRFLFESQTPVQWCLDGENGGLHETAEIICHKRRLTFIRGIN